MPAPLLSLTGAGKSFGAAPLFSNITLHISENERLGLIGPNGSGKSTLLKVLAGEIEADEGNVTRRKRVLVSYVARIPSSNPAPLCARSFSILSAERKFPRVSTRDV